MPAHPGVARVQDPAVQRVVAVRGEARQQPVRVGAFAEQERRDPGHVAQSEPAHGLDVGLEVGELGGVRLPVAAAGVAAPVAAPLPAVVQEQLPEAEFGRERGLLGDLFGADVLGEGVPGRVDRRAGEVGRGHRPAAGQLREPAAEVAQGCGHRAPVGGESQAEGLVGVERQAQPDAELLVLLRDAEPQRGLGDGAVRREGEHRAACRVVQAADGCGVHQRDRAPPGPVGRQGPLPSGVGVPESGGVAETGLQSDGHHPRPPSGDRHLGATGAALLGGQFGGSGLGQQGDRGAAGGPGLLGGGPLPGVEGRQGGRDARSGIHAGPLVGGAGGHCLTAPPSSPETNCRCRNRNRIAIGTAEIAVPVSSWP